MTEIVKPTDITGINKMQPEEINAFNEQVMQADSVLSNVTDELSDLSQSLYSLNETHEKYTKVSKHVKSQMRNLLGKL